MGLADSGAAFQKAIEHTLQGITGAFPDPLTPTEETAVNTFLFNEILNGNWSKYQSYSCFSLSGANALAV